MGVPLDEYLEFGLHLVRQAEATILPIYRGEFEVETKADRSPVTEADRRAERELRQLIEERYPDHSVLGEEYGESGPARASHRWILDPIDGTQSFTSRVPLFGTLVALAVEGEPVVGVAHFPALGQTAWARQGGGAFLDGETIRVRECAALDDALLCMTGLHFTELGGGRGEEKRVDVAPVLRRARLFRGWGDCYGHVAVARGGADVMIDPIMNPWDNAALVPILKEAGAAVFGIDGRDEDLANVDSLVSCVPSLRGELLELLGAKA